MTPKPEVAQEEKQACEIIELANVEIEKLAEALSFLADVSEFATFMPVESDSDENSSVH